MKTTHTVVIGIFLSLAAWAEEPSNALQPNDEKVGLLQGKLESLEEQYLETKNSVLSLSKLKVSGYIQARYQYNETSKDGLTSSGAAGVTDGFSIRRGRLKVQYQGQYAGFLLQTDATGSGVVLKDAEASLTEPWSGYGLTLVAGQTKWPFGYEIIQSSADREFPERTRVVRAFGPGERDRGIKLVAKAGWFRGQIGVFDGNGTQNTGFIGVDNDRAKDVIGRIGFDLKWLSAGVSGWVGNSFNPAVGHYFARNRIGADAQLYLDVLPFGATALKAEYIAGTTYQSGGVEKFGQSALGWYALLVQNIFEHEQIAVRYDFFNPATGTEASASSKDATKPSPTNPVHTVGFLVTHYFDDVMKVTVSYEIPLIEAGAPSVVVPNQKLLTLQFQAKF